MASIQKWYKNKMDHSMTQHSPEHKKLDFSVRLKTWVKLVFPYTSSSELHRWELPLTHSTALQSSWPWPRVTYYSYTHHLFSFHVSFPTASTNFCIIFNCLHLPFSLPASFLHCFSRCILHSHLSVPLLFFRQCGIFYPHPCPWSFPLLSTLLPTQCQDVRRNMEARGGEFVFLSHTKVIVSLMKAMAKILK